MTRAVLALLLAAALSGTTAQDVGAQALHEDLSGASFRNVCHKPQGGEYSDTVDRSLLPPIGRDAWDDRGNVVPTEKQEADRDRAVARVEALARRRGDLVRALDATFPETALSTKDLRNADPTRTCEAPASAEARPSPSGPPPRRSGPTRAVRL